VSSEFSDTVTEARRKFLDAANAVGATVATIPNPAPGPFDEHLAMDVARIGPANASKVLLLTSGMHGVEGYAGSAIQIGYLRAFDPTRLGPDTAVILVHLINPWGAAWDRRENEDNVDVFRNFLYCEKAGDDNPVYRELDEAINPRAWDGPVREEADRRLAAFIEVQGFDAFISAFRAGQTFNPKGMTYHGAGPVWSKRVCDEVLGAWLAAARSVVAVDFHTGFGDYAKGLVVMYQGQGDARLDFGRRCYGDLYIAGADPLIPTHSAMPFAYLEAHTDAAVHPVALEFGTYDLSQSIELFRQVNYLFAYEDPMTEEARGLRARMRELLYPAANDWRTAVLTRGLEVCAQAEGAIEAWAARTGERGARACA